MCVPPRQAALPLVLDYNAARWRREQKAQALKLANMTTAHDGNGLVPSCAFEQDADRPPFN